MRAYICVMLGAINALSHDQLTALYLQRESEIAEQQRQLHDRHVQELTARDEQITARDEQITARDEQITARDEQLRELKEQLLEKEELIEKLRRMTFGASRERFTVPDGQTVLPFIVDTEKVTDAVEKELASTVAEHTRRTKQKHPGRLPLPEHLPVVERVYEPDRDVTGLKCIGDERFDELDYVPARFFVVRHIRPKYITPEDANGDQQVVIARMPARPIDKCEASAELLATIITDKHISHLPVYRQLERFKALGVDIPRSTADNWQRLAGLLLRPLYAALGALVPQSSYLQADESGIAVQDRSKKGTTHRGMMWVYHAPISKLIYFDYQRGRGKNNCKQMLAEFSGFLQTDGYAAYNAYKAREGITGLACWAHVRRKFFDAQSNDQTRAETALKLIRKLYDVERDAREQELSVEERKELRLERSLPVVNAIGAWLARELEETKPRSAIGNAIRYTVALWRELENYLCDGNLEIDNNLIENAIRPLALGRKNYLFAGSHDAAVNIAMYRSFFATCRLNDVDAHRWLIYVLNTIGSTKPTEYHTLLPQNIDKTLLV